MAQKKINQLTQISAFADDCEVPTRDTDQTWKVTALQILDYIRGYLMPPVLAKTASYSLATTDRIVTMDATAATKTLTLPDAEDVPGEPITLKKIDSSSNTVQILTTSAQTIDGNASGALYLRAQYDTIRVVSDGSNWLILDMNFGIAGGDFIISY